MARTTINALNRLSKLSLFPLKYSTDSESTQGAVFDQFLFDTKKFDEVGSEGFSSSKNVLKGSTNT